MAKAVVHVTDLEVYKVINKGRKCNIYYQNSGNAYEQQGHEEREYVISTSGIGSELILDGGLQEK